IIFVDARNATLKAPAEFDTKTMHDSNTIDIKGLVDVDATKGQFAVTAWGEQGRIDIGGGKIVTGTLGSEEIGTGMPAISTTGNSVVNFNVTKGEDGKANGAGTNPVMIDGSLRTGTDFYGSGGSINLGLNTKESYLEGNVTVEGTSVGDPSYQAMGEGEAKIWMGNGAQWSGDAKASELGMLQINMTGAGTKWTGNVTGDATPALTLKDGAVFEPKAMNTVLGILNIDGGQLSLNNPKFTVSSQQGTIKYASDAVVALKPKLIGKLAIDNLTTLTGEPGTFFSNTDTKGTTAGTLVYSKDDNIQLVGGYLRLKTDEHSLAYADSANELIHSLVYNKKNSNTIVLFDGKLVLGDNDFGLLKMEAATEDTYQNVVGISDKTLTFGKTKDLENGQISHGINISSLRLINADTVTVENGAKLTLGSADAENLISSTMPSVTINVKGENSKFVLGRKADQTYKLTGGINVEDNASLEINGNYFAKGDIKVKNATLVVDEGAGITISDKVRKTVSAGKVSTSEGYAITLDNANLTVGKNVTMSADMIISGTSSMSGVASTTMLFGDSDAVLKIGSDKYGRLMIEDSMVIEPVKPYPAATTYNESKTGSYNGTVFVSAPAGASIDEVSVANYKTIFNSTYIKHKIIGGQNSIICVGGASVTDAIDMFKSTGLTWGEDAKAALYFKGNSPANTASNFGIYIDGTWTDVPEASNLGKSTSGGVIQIGGDSILMVDGASTGAM
ncbi:MAG: hypothetical protein KBS34_05560, partial [Phascolarctobacterium sp.]|nr:hypothetical protein [Candidatus Phascolarctobacterium equi]